MTMREAPAKKELTLTAIVLGVLLHRAWGFGSDMISAPQATLMKSIVEGMMLTLI